MAGKKGMGAYPVEIKLEAVRLTSEEGQTHAQVTAALGIRDPQRVEKWVRQYREEGVNGLQKKKGRPRKREREGSELERLRMEVALLKKFHSELREVQLAQRNIGCSTTIEKSSK
jgi:transposase